MNLSPRQRWVVLGGLLAATIAAGMLAEGGPPPDAPRKKPARTAPAGAGTRPGGTPDLQTAQAPLNFPEPGSGPLPPDELPVDPFRSKTWFVAPPPPPPPKPVAPPLPFQYLGKVVEDGQVRVFLARQGRYLIAGNGDAIDGTYRVEEIGGGRMTFLYQPLNERQTLAIGPDP